MGGRKYSLFSMFKSKKGTRSSSYDPCIWEEGSGVSKVYRSDEDTRYYWVAEPGIDYRASAFIAKFHEARRSEVQTLSFPSL